MPTLSTYETSLPSDEVLDIAVVVFNPGIADVDPKKASTRNQARRGDVYGARARSRVDDQGVWGLVGLCPSEHITDLLVTGAIEQSDGEASP